MRGSNPLPAFNRARKKCVKWRRMRDALGRGGAGCRQGSHIASPFDNLPQTGVSPLTRPFPLLTHLGCWLRHDAAEKEGRREACSS